MGNDFEKRLSEILSNNKSGSSEIKENLIRLFIDILSEGELPRKFIEKAQARLSEFAAVENFLKRFSKFNSASEQLNFLNKLSSKSDEVADKLYMQLKNSLHGNSKIVTISNSKTLVEIFLRASSDFPGIEIFVSESRPINEGIIMAEKLAENNVNVTLITEAMLPGFISTCDFALIGADKILPNGNVVNKIGSRLMAILCGYFGKPFFTIADKSKFSASNEIELKEYPKSEIYSGTNLLLKVGANYYFEIIEKNLITKIITA